MKPWLKPTYDQVNELLSYDPLSGLLTWKVNRRGTATAGSIAGYAEIRTKKPSYIRVTIFDRRYQAHHIAVLLMTGEWPDVVDHVDHNGLNNIWENLEVTDYQGNNRNRGFSKNASGHTGIYQKPATGNFYVNIGGIYRGTKGTLEEALILRNEVYKNEGYHANHGERV